MDFPGKEAENLNSELNGKIWLAKFSMPQYAHSKESLFAISRIGKSEHLTSY